MHTLGIRIAALVFGVALVGGGMALADPPSPPPGGPKELDVLTNFHASERAVTRTAEVSPVFGASPKVR